MKKTKAKNITEPTMRIAIPSGVLMKSVGSSVDVGVTVVVEIEDVMEVKITVEVGTTASLGCAVGAVTITITGTSTLKFPSDITISNIVPFNS